MSNIIQLMNSDITATDSLALAEIDVQSEWQRADDTARKNALLKQAFLEPLLAMMSDGVSTKTAYKCIAQKIATRSMPKVYLQAAVELASKNKQLPSAATVYNWVSAYQKNGLQGLLPEHKGRVRKDYGWESAALDMYHIPSKPSMHAVARKLREDFGWDSATDSRVARYLRSMPESLGENSKHRIGRHLYNNTQKISNLRTTKNLPVGSMYMADGHTLDLYLAHPNTGSPWRAELTLFMDVTSRYVVGWYISNAESSISTLSAFTRSLINHNHVPPMLYVDNGSGYKSKLMNGKDIGFYERLGIDVIFALPGNAKAKGQIERFFRTMEEDFNKFFPTYCGKDMAPEVINKLFNDIKKGKKQAPSLEQWKAAFCDWLDKYHNRPHPEYKQSTPSKIWQQLQPTAVNAEQEELMRPRIERIVNRGRLQLHNRVYKHQNLYEFNSKPVIIEYSLDTDEKIVVRTQNGELICVAELQHKKDFVPASRLEEAQQKTLKDSKKRLEKKIEENMLRGGSFIDAERQAGVRELLNDTTFLLEDKQEQAAHADSFDTSIIDDDDDSFIDITDV